MSLLARSTVASIRASLEETGQARCELVELRVDADQWRALARQAARNLDRSVETIKTEDHVVAPLRDWPQNDEERSITLDRMRRTISAIQNQKPLE